MSKYRRIQKSSPKRSKRPYAARGGIKSNTKGLNYGSTWWGRAWRKVFEPSAVDSRLARGRSYAKNGQVVDLNIDKGKIEASVQGSQLKPYEVSITVKTLGDEIWDTVLEQVRSDASLAATLMTGELPEGIDQVFQQAGGSLFPNRLRHISNTCECSDWSNPCKHSAAVYYILCESLDEDPLLLFLLRGRSRDEVIEAFSNASFQKLDSQGKAETEEVEKHELCSNAREFWATVDFDEFLEEHVRPSRVTPWPVWRLGSFPFWRGEKELEKELSEIYHRASNHNLNIYLSRSRRRKS